MIGDKVLLLFSSVLLCYCTVIVLSYVEFNSNRSIFQTKLEHCLSLFMGPTAPHLCRDKCRMEQGKMSSLMTPKKP